MSPALRAFALSFAVAAIAAVLVTLLMRWLAPRIGAVARPQSDRWHRHVIPLLGGIGVWAGVVAGLLAHGTGALTPAVLGVLGISTLLCGVGLVDDFLSLKPGTKLTAQIAAACLALVFLPGARLTHFGVLDVLLVTMWVVGITNAFNLLDNMDGVCAGVTAIAAVFYALAIGSETTGALVYAGALAGAAAGFLIFNFNPASIFLGDSGSLFIGVSFALLTFADGPERQTALLSALAVPAFVLLVPIFDTAFVTVSRKLSARSASVGGRDHTSHRLVALGFSERQTSVLLYALAVAGGGAAAALRHAAPLGVAIGALVIVALVLLGVGLSAVVVYNGDDFSLLRGRRYTPLLVDVAYRRRVFEILLDVFLIAIAYYVAYVVRFDAELAQHRVFFEQSLPVVIACQLSSSFVAGVYRGFWRYISVSELPIYIRAVVVGSVSSVLALVYVYRFEGYSRSVFVIYAMTIGLLLVGSRLFFRLLGEGASRSRHTLRPALLYGAGDAGALLVRELLNNESRGLRPVAFLDDDRAKLGRSVLGVPVIGSFENLSVMVKLHRPEVLIVSTELPYERLVAIAQIADRTGIDLLRFDFRLQPLRIEESLVAYAETHLSHK